MTWIKRQPTCFTIARAPAGIGLSTCFASYVLGKHGDQPHKQEKATQTVLEQAEVLSDQWAAA
jgi:hypothetical protein